MAMRESLLLGRHSYFFLEEFIFYGRAMHRRRVNFLAVNLIETRTMMVSLICSLVIFLAAGILFLLAHRSYTKRVGRSFWLAYSWDIKSYKGRERRLLVAAIILFLLSVLTYIAGNPVGS